MTNRHNQGFEVSASIGGMQDDYEQVTVVGSPTFIGGRLQGTALFVGSGVSCTFRTFAMTSGSTWFVGWGGRMTDPGAAGFTILKLLDTGGEQIRLDVIRGLIDTRNHIYKLMRGVTVLAQSAEYNFDSWEYGELTVVLATGATGSYTMRINEVTAVATSGGTGGFFTQATVQTANLGTSVAIKVEFSITAANALGAYLDDLYINDAVGSAPNNTFYGDYVLEGINPITPDDTAQFSTFGSASHFANVDDANAAGERHNTDVDYNFSTADAQTDLYTMSDLVFITGNILSVTVKANLRLTGAGTRNWKFRYKDISSVLASGATKALTQTSYRPGQEEIFNVDPVSTVAWTVARVNGAKLGILTG